MCDYGKFVKPILLFLVLAAVYAGIALEIYGDPAAPPATRTFLSGPHKLLVRGSQSVADTTVEESGFLFTRNRLEKGLLISCTWSDPVGKSNTTSLFFSDSVIAASQDGFGVSERIRNRYYKKYMPVFIEHNPEVAAIAAKVQRHEGPVHLPGYDTSNSSRVREAWEKFETGFLRSQGVLSKNGNQMRIDYRVVVKKQTGFMRPLAGNMVALADERNLNTLGALHILMGFVINMPYEVPPLKEDDRYIQGLWTPVEAAIYGKGDCDTKAVLFSAVANNIATVMTVIVTIPGHAFSGIKGMHKRLPRDFILSYRGADILLVDLTSAEGPSDPGLLTEYNKQHMRNRAPEMYETN